MSARVRWTGKEEFRADLAHLPEGLTAASDGIVQSAAQEAAAEIRQQYEAHRVTGNLAARVFVSRLDKGKFIAGRVVKSAAPHAWIFENGTQARHTKLGWNRGAMPPGHVFIPTVIRKRRAMQQALKALLVRFGLKVSGDER